MTVQFLYALASVALLSGLCVTVYPVTRWLCGAGAASMILAFPIGYLVHSLLLSFAASLLGFHVLTIVGYFILSIAVSAFLWRRSHSTSEPIISWTVEDRRALAFWIVGILIVTAPAFLNVGAETPDGYAYRAYFNTDVFRNMATAGSLVRTGIPPENPYFAGYTLHYYWLFHVIPAFWITILPGYRVEFIFVQFALLAALSFGAAMWCCARAVSGSARPTRWLLPLFLFGGSYEGLYVLNHLREKGMTWQQFTTLNVDGIMRWVEQLPQVDTLFRPLLYAPQHLMSVVVCLVLFLLWNRIDSPGRRITLLGLVLVSVGFSVIVGAINVLSVGCFLLIDLFRRRRGAWMQILLGGILGLVFLALYLRGYTMFRLGHGDLNLALPLELLKRLPAFFFYQWGAILFFGLAGIVFWRSKNDSYFRLLIILTLSTIFIVCIQIDVPGLSDVSLKAGYVHHSVMLLFSAKFLGQVLDRPSTAKWLSLGLLLTILPASVTWLMDAYNSQDIKNPKFTTYIAKPQMELYRWMNQHLESQAIIQDYFVPQSNFIESYVSETPPFANRALYVGDTILAQIFQTPKDELEIRRLIVDHLVESENPRMISHLADKAGVQYLVAYPQRNSPFDLQESRQYFQPVMQFEKWALYRVLKHPTPLYYEYGDFLVYDDQGRSALMTSSYKGGFHPAELLSDGEPARWMSQDGIIKINSQKEFHGSLVFLIHAFSRDRTVEVQWNGLPVLSEKITQTPVKVSIPVTLPVGESILKLHCPEGSQRGPGADRRLLSLKIWELQFRPGEQDEQN